MKKITRKKMLNIFEHFLQGTISDFEKCERRTRLVFVNFTKISITKNLFFHFPKNSGTTSQATSYPFEQETCPATRASN